MAVDSLFIPRPPLFLPWLDELGAATADNGNALEDVPEGPGPATAPKESEVAGAVVTELVVAGAVLLDVVGLRVVESLLRVCGVVL
jgi:hypothetical protein